METGKKHIYGMGKREKLRHKTLVDGVFAEGKTLYDYPLRVTYRALGRNELSGAFCDHVPERIGELQMLITVPKKKIRHAVDRVKIRRRIRESYRLNRLELQEAVNASDDIRTLGMAFIYLHKEEMDYSAIERKMKRLLQKIAGEISGGKKGGN